MTRYLVIIFWALFVFSWNMSGQVADESRSDTGILSLRIKSISFIKNNEYFNPIIEGYTMLGFLFQPELVYSPSPKVTLRAGIHLLKYSGANKFSQVRPVFSTTLNFSEKISLTIGTLSGSDKHQLFDPHFNRERLYNAYAEDGFQLTTVNNNLFNDTWISWENFIFKGDTTREIFTYGESFRYKSSPVADFLQFEVPVQIQFKHFGGQISNYPERVETFFNLATGLRINCDLAQKRYGQAGIEYLQFINNQLNGLSPGEISHGYASWIRLHYTYKVFYIGAAYWKSHNFFAPNGSDIYSSVSDYQNVIIPDRKIITNTFNITLIPESYLELFLGFETYYDINLKRLDNALTLHLNFEKLIKLATLKH
ncbi:MAG: hypothetical protein EPN88_08580 [Bacteroidetes bacterium]|nr:MAG: hypothetical protein EPN88_08580 [Bacteroidota bacterium]